MSASVRSAPSGRTASAPLALLSGFLGWMFDAMDFNLFILVMLPALHELMGTTNPAAVARIGGLVIAVKTLGWGFGGIVFGVIADRVGRSATLAWTILIYGVFTALSSLAGSWESLALCQFLAGLGIGGEWAAGAALVAEAWPDRSRARAMQVMQMAYPFGLMLAAGLSFLLGPFGWRVVLVAGVLPVLAAVFVRQAVPEPALWIGARQLLRERAAAGGPPDTAGATFAAILAPGMRRNTAIGVLVSLALITGSWAVLTLLPGWVRQLVGPAGAAEVGRTVSWCFMLISIGNIVGYLVLMGVADRIGRRWCYFVSCTGMLATVLYMCRAGTTLAELEHLLPLLGFCFGGGFGTLAVYLPELFPTSIRATGQGFCYNMSRFLTAPGPLIAGLLVGAFGSIPRASAAVAWFLIVGAIAIWFGTETKGRPLPGDPR